MEQDTANFNKLILHPSFNETINDINRLKIKIPSNPIVEEMDFNPYVFPSNGKLKLVEEFKNYKLEPKKGQYIIKSGIPISAYDESINKFVGLEGTTFLIAHSLVILTKDDYLPSCFITFYFYTRSKIFTENSKFIKYSKDPETDSKLDYIKDRLEFILKIIPNNSIIFIDGPLIGGQASAYTIKLNGELLKRNIIPIFFVKNSSSNLVTENLAGLGDKYNSDIHWAYKILAPGERSSLFKYEDEFNPNNSKLFCYLKAFDGSPQRIEFHVSTFNKFKNEINGLLNLAYYLLLNQGSLKNPQVRTIAIAEKYARSAIKLINLNKLMTTLGIAATINQERFGWG